MAERQQIEVADLFDSIVSSLKNDRDYLNQLDRRGGNGNHGDNALSNFEVVQRRLREQQGQGDVGRQLRSAAEALRQQGKGKTASIYAGGLEDAAQRFSGQSALDAADLLPFLQAILSGTQRESGAQPGEGTMMDALVPGIMAFMEARNGGRSTSEAIFDALGAAMRGSRTAQRRRSSPVRTTTRRPASARSRVRRQEPTLDPGAASATTVLEGIFRNVLGL